MLTCHALSRPRPPCDAMYELRRRAIMNLPQIRSLLLSYLFGNAVQAKGFELQFELAERSRLPVFFHSRACRHDFATIVRRNRDRISGGVVHSFTGTREEAEELVSMGGLCVWLFAPCTRPLLESKLGTDSRTISLRDFPQSQIAAFRSLTRPSSYGITALETLRVGDTMWTFCFARVKFSTSQFQQ